MTSLIWHFLHSKIYRRAITSALEIQGVPIKGHRRAWQAACRDIFQELPEGEVKALLYSFLLTGDITAEERLEILKLLQLSQTTYTATQRKQLESYLQR